MSNYFICVGGTGSRIGEVFVYLAATGYFHEGRTKIWMVDKDTQCGDGAQLTSTYNAYVNFRTNCREAGDWFGQNLSLDVWNFEQALEAINPDVDGKSPFKKLSTNPQTDIAMKFLHDAGSLDDSMDEGFYGRAQTGTALYKGIEKIPAFFVTDGLFQDIQNEINLHLNPCIYLAGSSFGATGASLLPNMAKTMRNVFGQNVTIGAVLMMPYYTFTESADGVKKMVDPTQFISKAKEALRYYGDGNRMSIRTIGTPFAGGATLDAFYIVGCDPISSTNEKYHTGGAEQENFDHIAELYAVMGAKHFFDRASGGVPENPDDNGKKASYVYCLDIANGVFNWNQVEEDVKKYMLLFTRYCLAELTWLHPTTHTDEPLNLNENMKDCFGTYKKRAFGPRFARINVTDAQQSTEDGEVFSKRFLDFLWQITVRDDVELFDRSFLEQCVCMALKNENPAGNMGGTRFRDLVLQEKYTDDQRKRIQQWCQLLMITSHHRNNRNLALNLADFVRDRMGEIKNELVADGNFHEHTVKGMKKMHQLVYDYGATFPLEGVAPGN